MSSKIQCKICERSFDSELSLGIHKRIHPEFHKFKCSLCDSTYQTKKSYLRHLKNYHKNNDLTGSDGESLVRSAAGKKENADKYTCMMCNGSFFSLAEYRTHLLSHATKKEEAEFGEEEKQHICGSCGVRYKLKKSLDAHMKCHSDNPFKCDVCSRVFFSKDSLKVHSTIHTGECKFSCKECGKKFRCHKSLKRHKFIHTKVMPVNCNLCDASFFDNTQLKDHMYKDHLNVHFPCNVCGKSFSTEALVKTHLKRHISEKQKYACKICRKLFAQKKSLTKHMDFHSKKYKCLICNKVLVSEMTFKSHMNLHDPKSLYTCMECGAKFGSIYTLKSHSDKHLDGKSFACDVCSRSFYTKETLKRHILIHTDIKPYMCNFCGKKFRKKINLNVHERTHEGIRLYSCPHCNFKFSQNTGLKRHLDRNTGNAPYDCQNCSASFNIRCLLLQHSHTHKIENKSVKRRKRSSKNVQSLSCKLCRINFLHKRPYNHHLKIHQQNPFHCRRCLENFPSSCDLLKHNCSKAAHHEQGFWDKMNSWTSSLDEHSCLNVETLKSENEEPLSIDNPSSLQNDSPDSSLNDGFVINDNASCINNSFEFINLPSVKEECSFADDENSTLNELDIEEDLCIKEEVEEEGHSSFVEI